MKRNRVRVPLVLGSVLITLLFCTTAISVLYTPYNPTVMVIANRFSPPSAQHLFGTDQYGRDIFSRVMAGGRASLAIGLIAVFSGMLFGVVLGSIAGYFGGRWDEILMRIADGLYSFPAFLLALLAVTIWGPGQGTAMVAIAIANVPIFMRIVRANFLSLRQTTFIEAARAMGATDGRIIRKHLLPNTLPPLIVQITVSFAAAILAEASLSYLGVGVQPPEPSWGRMLREAQSFATHAPWTVMFPGLAIALTVLGFNLIGDGLQDSC